MIDYVRYVLRDDRGQEFLALNKSPRDYFERRRRTAHQAAKDAGYEPLPGPEERYRTVDRSYYLIYPVAKFSPSP